MDEFMVHGSKFEEAVQKAVRMLDIGFEGILDEKAPSVGYKKPTPWRLFAIAKALKNGSSPTQISKTSGIDAFFIGKLKNIVDLEKNLRNLKDVSLIKKA